MQALSVLEGLPGDEVIHKQKEVGWGMVQRRQSSNHTLCR
jgi:hypothetical protein